MPVSHSMTKALSHLRIIHNEFAQLFDDYVRSIVTFSSSIFICVLSRVCIFIFLSRTRIIARTKSFNNFSMLLLFVCLLCLKIIYIIVYVTYLLYVLLPDSLERRFLFKCATLTSHSLKSFSVQLLYHDRR